MKKSLINLGKILPKAQQRTINGGGYTECVTSSDCPNNMMCCYIAYYRTEICTWEQFC